MTAWRKATTGARFRCRDLDANRGDVCMLLRSPDRDEYSASALGQVSHERIQVVVQVVPAERRQSAAARRQGEPQVVRRDWRSRERRVLRPRRAQRRARSARSRPSRSSLPGGATPATGSEVWPDEHRTWGPICTSQTISLSADGFRLRQTPSQGIPPARRPTDTGRQCCTGAAASVLRTSIRITGVVSRCRLR